MHVRVRERSSCTNVIPLSRRDDLVWFSTRFPMLRAISAMAIVACCCACSSETPEDRVRSVIEQAESAVENRELKPLMRLFSESYSDSRGNDKRAIEGLLRFSFAQYDSIHVLSRIRSLQVTGVGYRQSRSGLRRRRRLDPVARIARDDDRRSPADRRVAGRGRLGLEDRCRGVATRFAVRLPSVAVSAALPGDSRVGVIPDPWEPVPVLREVAAPPAPARPG